MKRLITGALFVALMSGCASQTYLLAPQGDSPPTEDQMQSFFVGGLGQEQKVNAAGVCGSADQVQKVETQQTFLDGFLNAITYGLYSPRHLRVHCK